MTKLIKLYYVILLNLTYVKVNTSTSTSITHKLATYAYDELKSKVKLKV